MVTVEEVLQQKGRRVVTVRADATVLEAARVMNEHRIGALVVEPMFANAGPLAGIFTERDILTRVVANGLDPAATKVSEVMTCKVQVCESRTQLDEIRQTMRERRIRHIPVVEDGRLIGMVSLGDLNAAATRTLVETIQYLEEYITHG